MIRVFSCLQRHSQSGILYFRRSIPKRLRPYFNGRCEYKRSLKTHNKNVAIPLAMGLYSQVQIKFNELEEVPKVSDDNYFSKIEIKEIELPGGGKIKGFLADNGDLDKEEEVLHQTIKLVSEIKVPAEQQTHTESSPVFQSKKLADVIAEFCADRKAGKKWSPKTAEEYEASLSLLIQWFRNVPIETIRASDARKFRGVLLQLPTNHTKGEYVGKTIRQIIAMKPEKVIADRTVNQNYLQRYASLFDWAVTERYCAVNPFKNLKVKLNKKATDEREPFSASDIKQIFNSAYYEKPSDNYSWKFWLPLMGLFTGCRVNEIAQLRVIDVFEENDIYALDITEKAGSLKNISSNRVVPLHPTLLNLKFLEYVEKMEESGQERLFPELYNTQKIKPGDKVSRWFNNTYLKKCGLKPTDRKISFHSFRHSFVDYFKKHDFPETKVKQLTGHSHEGMTYGRYGSGYNLTELFDLIEQIKFENK